MRLLYYSKKSHIILFTIIIISTIFRIIAAETVELGNDEVYYRIFALFPQLSYYDHPPLLSLIIRLTTLGSEQPIELLVRLSSIIIGAVNTYLIFAIAQNRIFGAKSEEKSNTQISQSERRGLFAALIYSGSIYASVIVGTFIMPDTPLSLFWLLSLLLFVQILPKQSNFSHSKMLMAGVMIGFAMLSKYTGAYLWGATGLYILLFNRELLKKWSLYVAPIISIVVFLPVIIWNAQNEFISFTFHSGRVVAEGSIEWLYFGRELIGGLLYNNPINYILIITSLVVYGIQKRNYISSDALRLMLCFSLPMIFLFLLISLTRETLPHWAAPGYFALIIVAATYLSSIDYHKAKIWVTTSVSLIVLTLLLGIVQINTGVLMGANSEQESTELGRDDVTLDMYGWRKFGKEFSAVYQNDIDNNIMPCGADIYSSVWFEAAHLDCYVALPNSLKLKTIASVDNSHLYDWITQWRGGIDLSKSAYFIVSSRYFRPESQIFVELGITENTPCDTITINRGTESVVNFFIYRINPLK